MAKIMIGGAGGAPSEGVIYSLMRSNSHHIIGVGSDPSDLILSQAGEKYLVPRQIIQTTRIGCCL